MLNTGGCLVGGVGVSIDLHGIHRVGKLPKTRPAHRPDASAKFNHKFKKKCCRQCVKCIE